MELARGPAQTFGGSSAPPNPARPAREIPGVHERSRVDAIWGPVLPCHEEHASSGALRATPRIQPRTRLAHECASRLFSRWKTLTRPVVLRSDHSASHRDHPIGARSLAVRVQSSLIIDRTRRGFLGGWRVVWVAAVMCFAKPCRWRRDFS